MSLLSHSAGLGLARLAEKGLAFAVIIAASRLYGSEGLGEFFYYFSLACLFLPMLDLGMPKLLLQDWFGMDVAARRSHLSQMLQCKTALTALAILIALAVDLLVRGPKSQPLAVFFAMLAIAFENAALFVRTPDQARDRWRLEAGIPLLARCCTLALLFLLAGRLDHGWQIAILYAASNALALLLSLPSLRGHLPKLERPRGWGSLIRRGLPFSLTGVFAMISLHIDSVMLGRFSLEEVGLYNAGYRVVLVGIAVTGGACHALFPRIVRLREAGETDEAARMVGRVLRILLIFGVTGAAGGILVAGGLMPFVYGEAFASAALPFAILCLLLPISTANNILGHALEASGGQGQAMWITLRSACLNVGTNLLLIPVLGMVGAAITTVLTELASLLQLLWGLRQGNKTADLADVWRVLPFGLTISLAFGLLVPFGMWTQIAFGVLIFVALLGAFHRFWLHGLLNSRRTSQGEAPCVS